ncbi:MAG: hypothetical protein AAGE80_03835 [Pseudomonadota bacterium]
MEPAEPHTYTLRNSLDHGLDKTPTERGALGKPRADTLRLSGERLIIPPGR